MLSNGIKLLLTWQAFQLLKRDILRMVLRFSSVDGISLLTSGFLAFALTPNPRIHEDRGPSFLWHLSP